jgi:hypothetical protein
MPTQEPALEKSGLLRREKPTRLVGQKRTTFPPEREIFKSGARGLPSTVRVALALLLFVTKSVVADERRHARETAIQKARTLITRLPERHWRVAENARITRRFGKGTARRLNRYNWEPGGYPVETTTLVAVEGPRFVTVIANVALLVDWMALGIRREKQTNQRRG